MVSKEKVEDVLNTQVRPFLMSHGGNIELVDVTQDGVVKVKLVGGCAGCSGARATLSGVVETAIKENIKDVKAVEAV
jgi:Fe-S cluster biogenesis protein NfuA